MDNKKNSLEHSVQEDSSVLRDVAPLVPVQQSIQEQMDVAPLVPVQQSIQEQMDEVLKSTRKSNNLVKEYTPEVVREFLQIALEKGYDELLHWKEKMGRDTITGDELEKYMMTTKIGTNSVTKKQSLPSGQSVSWKNILYNMGPEKGLNSVKVDGIVQDYFRLKVVRTEMVREYTSEVVREFLQIALKEGYDELLHWKEKMGRDTITGDELEKYMMTTKIGSYGTRKPQILSSGKSTSWENILHNVGVERGANQAKVDGVVQDYFRLKVVRTGYTPEVVREFLQIALKEGYDELLHWKEKMGRDTITENELDKYMNTSKIGTNSITKKQPLPSGQSVSWQNIVYNMGSEKGFNLVKVDGIVQDYFRLKVVRTEMVREYTSEVVREFLQIALKEGYDELLHWKEKMGRDTITGDELEKYMMTTKIGSYGTRKPQILSSGKSTSWDNILHNVGVERGLNQAKVDGIVQEYFRLKVVRTGYTPEVVREFLQIALKEGYDELLHWKEKMGRDTITENELDKYMNTSKIGDYNSRSFLKLHSSKKTSLVNIFNNIGLKKCSSENIDWMVKEYFRLKVVRTEMVREYTPEVVHTGYTPEVVREFLQVALEEGYDELLYWKEKMGRDTITGDELGKYMNTSKIGANSITKNQSLPSGQSVSWQNILYNMGPEKGLNLVKVDGIVQEYFRLKVVRTGYTPEVVREFLQIALKEGYDELLHWKEKMGRDTITGDELGKYMNTSKIGIHNKAFPLKLSSGIPISWMNILLSVGVGNKRSISHIQLDFIIKEYFGLFVSRTKRKERSEEQVKVYTSEVVCDFLQKTLEEKYVELISWREKMGRETITKSELDKYMNTSKIGDHDRDQPCSLSSGQTTSWGIMLENVGLRTRTRENIDWIIKNYFFLTVVRIELVTEYTPEVVHDFLQKTLEEKYAELISWREKMGRETITKSELDKYMNTSKIGDHDDRQPCSLSSGKSTSWVNVLNHIGLKKRTRENIYFLLKEYFHLTVLDKTQELSQAETLLDATLEQVQEGENTDSFAAELRAALDFFGARYGESVLTELVLGDPRFQPLRTVQIQEKIGKILGNVTPRGTFIESFAKLSEGTLHHPTYKDLAKETLKTYFFTLVQETFHQYLRNEIPLDRVMDIFVRERALLPKNLVAHHQLLQEIEDYYLDIFTFPVSTALVTEVNGKPFPSLNQRLHAYETKKSKRRLNADAMGAGKTGAALLASLDKQRVLIVTPNTRMSDQWYDNITGERGYFQKGQRPQAQKVEQTALTAEDIAPDTQYLIINIDKFTLAGKNKKVLLETIKGWEYDMVIFDEAHSAKNPHGDRVAVMQSLITHLPEEGYLNELTGTPAPNRVSDLAMRLWALFPEYVPDQQGTVNNIRPLKDWSLQEIEKLILFEDPLLVRNLLFQRMQQKSLKEVRNVPEPTYVVHTQTLSPEEKTLYNHLLEEDEYDIQWKLWRLQEATLDPQGYFGVHPEAGQTKYEGVKTRLQELLPEKKHIVLFTNQRSEGMDSPFLDGHALSLVEKLSQDFPEVCVQSVNTTTKQSSHLTALVERAKSHPQSITVIGGKIGAEGLNQFVYAKHVGVYNLPWNIATLEQEVARVVREGQTEEITVDLFVTKDTLEEGIHTYITRKQEAIDHIFKGKHLSELEKQLVTTEGFSDLVHRSEEFPVLVEYLLGSRERLNAYFGQLKKVGKEEFLNRIEKIGPSYAKLYKERYHTSYGANNARWTAHRWEEWMMEKAGAPGWILDLGSGPEILKKHSPLLADHILSIDANPHHFSEETSRNVMVSHFSELPVRSNSLFGVNCSFAFHYTALNNRKTVYDRLESLLEMNRVLEMGGRVLITLPHTVIVEEERLQRFLSVCETHLGFTIDTSFTGVVEGEGNYHAYTIALTKTQDLAMTHLSDQILTIPEQREALRDTLLETFPLEDLKFDKGSGRSELNRKEKPVEAALRTQFVMKPLRGEVITETITLTEEDQGYQGARTAFHVLAKNLAHAYPVLSEIPTPLLEEHGLVFFTLPSGRKDMRGTPCLLKTTGPARGEVWKKR